MDFFQLRLNWRFLTKIPRHKRIFIYLAKNEVGCFKRGKNFKWLKFIPPTANSCYLGQNISWGQKIFQKFWFLDIPMSCQSFLKNHLVKWPFSVAIWSGKKKFNFLQLFCFKLCFCFLGINFVLKMWSFEIYYVDVM